MGPEPGWHPDANDPHTTRYWDGMAWTSERVWDGAAWVERPVDPEPEPEQEPERAGWVRSHPVFSSLTTIAVIIAVGLLWTSCHDDANQSAFEGTWSATGYFCGSAPKTEIVRIHVRSKRLKAVKLKGDQCVHAGSITFDGPPRALRCWTAFPGTKPTPSGQGTITVVSRNKLKLQCTTVSTTLTRVG